MSHQGQGLAPAIHQHLIMHRMKLQLLLCSLLSLTLSSAARGDEDIGTWKSISSTRPAFYQDLGLPSLRELSDKHPESKINRLVVYPGWARQFAFTMVVDQQGQSFVHLHARSETQHNLVFHFQMEPGWELRQVVETIQRCEKSLAWKSNTSDQVGDDQGAILFEHYDPKQRGYVIKTHSNLEEDFNKALFELAPIVDAATKIERSSGK